MPFDWMTPVGYPIAWFLQFAGDCASFSITLIILNFMIGSCWLFIFFATDITNDLAAYNSEDEMANVNHVEKLKRFCDIIQLYADAKQ